MKFFLKHKYESVLVLFVLIYILYFSVASFTRYENYYTGRFDLGNMAQTVWNTSHGKIFLLTNPNGTEEISRLAFHADFILILLTPFYLIWSDPKVLLLLQTIILGAGAFFVYLTSNEAIKNKKFSVGISAAYLLYPAIQYTNLYDFHGVTLATTFLLATFYFILKKRYLLFLVFLILSGITKENVWAISAIFGLYIILFNKKVKLGLAVFIASSLIFYYLVWHAIPQALGGQHFALAYFSDFGSTPSGVVGNIILSPIKTLHTLLGAEQIDYIKKIFIPNGYFSFFAPIILVFTIPSFLIDLLSNNPQLHQIYYQYSSTITPFVFISTIFGISFIAKRVKLIPVEVFAIMILVFTLTSAYSYGPLPFAKKPSLDMFQKPLVNKPVVDNYLSNIPDQASIASTNNLGSHLSEREKIYTVPLGINKADYVMFLLTEGEFNLNQEGKIAEQMKHNPNYHLEFSQDNFLVFKLN